MFRKIRSFLFDENGSLVCNSDKKRCTLGFLGLYSIGIVSLGYVKFIRPFAEMNLQLPFLDLPIFIGEILLFFCLCILFFKGDLRYDTKYFWVYCYFAFVIFKALWGYSKYGPLALRDAALFYYPAFIIFTNSFFQSSFINNKQCILFSACILILLIRTGFNEYYLFTCISLLFILFNALPEKKFRYLSMALLVFVIPYKYIFATSRMGMVANFTAGTYLIIGLYFISRIEKAKKLAMVVLGVLIIIFLIFRFSDRISLITLMRPNIIFSKFIEHDQLVKELRKKNLKIGQRPGESGTYETDGRRRVQIYNPDPLFPTPRLLDEEETIRKRIEANQTSVTNDNSLISETSGNHQVMYSEEDDVIGVELPDSVRNAATLAISDTFVENTGLVTKPDVNVDEKTVIPSEQSANMGKDGTAELKPEKQAGNVPPTSSGNTLIEDAGAIMITAVYTPTLVKSDTFIENTGLVTKPDIIGDEEAVTPEKEKAFKEVVGIKSKPVKSLINFDDLEGYGGKNLKESGFREVGPAYGNAVFRLLIWRDMLVEMIRDKPILGFSFGKPLRSISLETLMWGYGDWHRDGWIGAHNSFLHIIYRSGVVGLFLIGFILKTLYNMIMKSIQCKSLIGVLLCGIIINWFTAANFLLILELPYTAIPIWAIFGLTYAYVGKLRPAL